MRLREFAASRLNEAITQRDWVFYHGTRSGPFDQFIPSQAAKGEQFWNPLGHGMYVTDSASFAVSFGPHVHKVIVPAGSTYRRINRRTWNSTGFGLVMRAVRRAFKQAGENYDEWEKGIAVKLPKKMTRPQMFEMIRKQHPNEPDLEAKMAAASDEVLYQTCKNIITYTPRQRDPQRIKKIEEFRREIYRVIEQNSPYEGLYESSALVDMIFGNVIGEAYEQALPALSTEVFSKFDFIVFTDTNDIIGLGKNGGSALEVVIFNPALQKAIASQE